MAVEDYSLDEILTIIEDAFDSTVSPKKIFRDDNNKMHLMYKGDAAGLQLINKMVLSLKRRFDPQYCPDSDLPSTARMAGTKFLPAKASLVQITVSNTSNVEDVVLAAGVYLYPSATGEIFTFTIGTDTLLSATEARAYSAVSQNTGSFPVSTNTTVMVKREDSATIDSNLVFSTEENSSYLGYAAETIYEFRKRMLTDANRQDEIVQIENDIKALTNIFECNCVFNALTEPKDYDGITLGTHELLVVITGSANDELADVVAKHTVHKTHIVDPLNVVYHNDDMYVGGRYPVYFMHHLTTDYELIVSYNYDSTKLKTAQIEAAFNTLLARYKNTNRHVDTVTEYDVYSRLNEALLANVSILNVNLLVGGVEVPYVSVPKTRLPRLTTVTYAHNDVVGG